MCPELVHCGNVSSSCSGLWDCCMFSPCSLDVQTNWALCEDSDKRQAYGRGEEESGGSRSDVGKVESPADSPGTTTRKRNVRFTGFSVLLGNKEALTHLQLSFQIFTGRGDEWMTNSQPDVIPEKRGRWISHKFQLQGVTQFFKKVSQTLCSQHAAMFSRFCFSVLKKTENWEEREERSCVKCRFISHNFSFLII